MATYSNLIDDIFSVFASPAWQAELIPTVPNNFTGTSMGKRFIRVSVIPNGMGINRLSKSGILLVDIFVTVGDGPKDYLSIADTLDSYLANQTLRTKALGTTQFGTSAVSPMGTDPDNEALFRASYSIPFNYFGAI